MSYISFPRVLVGKFPRSQLILLHRSNMNVFLQDKQFHIFKSSSCILLRQGTTFIQRQQEIILRQPDSKRHGYEATETLHAWSSTTTFMDSRLTLLKSKFEIWSCGKYQVVKETIGTKPQCPLTFTVHTRYDVVKRISAQLKALYTVHSPSRYEMFPRGPVGDKFIN